MPDDNAPRRVQLVAADASPTPQVRLQYGARTVLGTAAAASLPGVAEATLDALAQLVPPAAVLSLAELHEVNGGAPLVAVVVHVTLHEAVLAHAGCALVRANDPEVATARATLAALNRRLEVLGL